MEGTKQKAWAGRFANLSREIAKVYNLDNAPEVFDADYETQIRSPQFITALLFNCMVMNSIYGCRRGGCAGCRAREMFDSVSDPSVKAKISLTMRMLEKETLP